MPVGSTQPDAGPNPHWEYTARVPLVFAYSLATQLSQYYCPCLSVLTSVSCAVLRWRHVIMMQERSAHVLTLKVCEAA
eukprot:3588589-Rhodomonas_salina.13